MTTGIRRAIGGSLAVGVAVLVAAGGCSRKQELADAAVTQDVTSRIEKDPDLGRFEVVVTTQDGVVTLTGIVDEEAQRTEAAQIARDTDGVVDVVNHLETQKSPGAYRTPDVGAPPAEAPPGTRAPAAPEEPS
jgi:hypothetical protein